MGVLRQVDLEYFRKIFQTFKTSATDIKFSDENELPALRGWRTRQDKPGQEKDTNGIEKHNLDKENLWKCELKFKTKPEPVTVKVIGVWDTVGASGWPESWFTNFAGFNKV